MLPAINHPVCTFPNRIEKEVPRRVIARKEDIRYSTYKLNACAMIVRKKHIYDALTLIGNVNKKGGKLIKSVLEAARFNAKNKGMSDERLYVKEIVLGRKLGPKKLDIRARGKFGIIHSTISSITVILEEKSPAEFFKMMITGNCPPTIGYIFK